PRDPDTDKDGIPDGIDRFPSLQAALICVDANAPAAADTTFCQPPFNPACGWGKAVRTLQEALALHAQGEASISFADDVAEIWVADGTYRPDQTAASPGGTGDRFKAFEI